MSYQEVSCDPNAPFTVEEFEIAFDTWIESIISSKEEIQNAIANVDVEKISKKISDAIQMERFKVYKDIFWNLKHHDYL